jgi:hypothetical protein
MTKEELEALLEDAWKNRRTGPQHYWADLAIKLVPMALRALEASAEIERLKKIEKLANIVSNSALGRGLRLDVPPAPGNIGVYLGPGCGKTYLANALKDLHRALQGNGEGEWMPKGRPKMFPDVKTTDQERIEADRLAVEAWLSKGKRRERVAKNRGPLVALIQPVDHLFQGRIKGSKF